MKNYDLGKKNKKPCKCKSTDIVPTLLALLRQNFNWIVPRRIKSLTIIEQFGVFTYYTDIEMISSNTSTM